MEPYSAWHALIQSETFFWYLILAVLVMAVSIAKLIKGVNELTGNDRDQLLSYIEQRERQCRIEETGGYARWQVDLTTIIMELKHDRSWAVNKHGEALMVAALQKVMSYVRFTELDFEPVSTVAGAEEIIKASDAFKIVSGADAQAIANRRQLAFALCQAKDDDQVSTAALVIPGDIYPGTPFGNDNPMVLLFGQDSAMELQAAVAFSRFNKPVYYAVKNLEC